MSERKRVLFAHERQAIARAVDKVLGAHGFDVSTVPDGDGARAALEAEPFDGLVVDVALPGIPGYELTAIARERGVGAVVLVASVYRRTSYKRRPTRLYGADDYVEIHHLGDQLPEKLRKHLGLPPAPLQGKVSRTVADELQDEGDSRFDSGSVERLASLIVADMILYNGDVMAEGLDPSEAAQRLASDLDGARELLVEAHGGAKVDGDPIGDAFVELTRHLPPEPSNGGAAATGGDVGKETS